MAKLKEVPKQKQKQPGKGSEHSVDFASTKAAIIGFTRSLAKMMAKKRYVSTELL